MVAKRLGTFQSMLVRPMTFKDCAHVAPLISELGYPVDPIQLQSRFEALDSKVHEVYVAEENGIVCGWIHAELRTALAASKRVEIMGMIVSRNYQGKGIGKLLLQQIEKWANSKNVDIVRVTSNLARKDSHPFYISAGYELQKQSAVYAKPLTASKQLDIKY